MASPVPRWRPHGQCRPRAACTLFLPSPCLPDRPVQAGQGHSVRGARWPVFACELLPVLVDGAAVVALVVVAASGRRAAGSGGAFAK